MADEPIGTIVAYGGNVFGPEEEEHSGWLLCDGRLMDGHDAVNVALFEAIGFTWGGDGAHHFNLPDLRGYFLRGFDERQDATSRDPDSSTRTANRPGGATGNAVGTVQGYATATPKPPNPFHTTPDGVHRHQMDFETSASRDVASEQFNTVASPGGISKPQTDEAGGHVHGIVGGNKE